MTFDTAVSQQKVIHYLFTWLLINQYFPSVFKQVHHNWIFQILSLGVGLFKVMLCHPILLFPSFFFSNVLSHVEDL